ncbi:MAG: hypothetical protein LUD68_08975, partial [Rikenellaceae bacterium]|nr:hypothetical protein [Rikenellaceae bacterium]
MNQLPVYYPGSSVVVRFRVRGRHRGFPIPLADYHAEASLYTRLSGEAIEASNREAEKIPICAVNEFVLQLTLPPEASIQLPLGLCKMDLKLTHKAAGTPLRI